MLIITTKTNKMKPIPKRACLKSPLEYEISIAIPVVKSRTGFKILGGLTIFPATIITAIVSPIAFATAKVIPEKIPDLEAFKVILKIVCIFVAPRFKEASLKEFGIFLIAT